MKSPQEKLRKMSVCGKLPADFFDSSFSLVKHNGQRSVWRVTTGSGECYYVKLDEAGTLSGIFKGLFRSKSASEYLSYQRLKSLSIPCPEHVALLRRFWDSGIVTKELDSFVTSTEFWYTAAFESFEKRRKFISNLSNLCGALLTGMVRHPDFHAGNLMVNVKDCSLSLIDLYGIETVSAKESEMEFLSRRNGILHIFSDFADYLDHDELVEAIGNVLYEDSTILSGEILLRARRNITSQWPKRESQILSGDSKFCRTENDIIIRSTPWYSPCRFSFSEVIATELPHSEARKIWIDSFRKQLIKLKNENAPLGWKRGSDGIDTLYFPPKEIPYFKLQSPVD